MTKFLRTSTNATYRSVQIERAQARRRLRDDHIPASYCDPTSTCWVSPGEHRRLSFADAKCGLLTVIGRWGWQVLPQLARGGQAYKDSAVHDLPLHSDDSASLQRRCWCALAGPGQWQPGGRCDPIILHCSNGLVTDCWRLSNSSTIASAGKNWRAVVLRYTLYISSSFV